MSRFPTLSAVFACFALFAAGPALAQDDFSLPGDAPEPESTTTSSSSNDEGSGAAAPKPQPKKVYGNFLSKLFGIGGAAMYVLAVLLFIVIALAIYCGIDLTKRSFYPDDLVRTLKDDLSRGDLAAGLSHAQKSKTCLGQVMYGATEYIGDRGYQVLDDSGLYDSMSDASQEFNRGRARNINYFSVIAQASPMVGLLGTVSGMIKAFNLLADSGNDDPAKLATAISEALWTTAGGLVVALISIFVYFLFRDKLTALVATSDRHAVRLLNDLRRAIVKQTAGQSSPTPPAT